VPGRAGGGVEDVFVFVFRPWWEEWEVDWSEPKVLKKGLGATWRRDGGSTLIL
jgi:hypothetical protein